MTIDYYNIERNFKNFNRIFTIETTGEEILYALKTGKNWVSGKAYEELSKIKLMIKKYFELSNQTSNCLDDDYDNLREEAKIIQMDIQEHFYKKLKKYINEDEFCKITGYNPDPNVL